MTGHDLVNWEAKFRGPRKIRERKREIIESPANSGIRTDAFGADDTIAEVEQAEQSKFKTKWWELHKRDVTELAAISTLALFGFTLFEKLVIQNIPRRKTRRA